MITFDSPGHAKTDEALQKTVREHYIKVRPEQEIKEKINGFLRLKKDLSATLKLQCEGCEITCEGEQVLQAQKQPLSRDRVDVCMRKQEIHRLHLNSWPLRWTRMFFSAGAGTKRAA